MTQDDVVSDQKTATEAFARHLGVPSVPSAVEPVGHQLFLRFFVGRVAPVFDRALRLAQKDLPESNQFRGACVLVQRPSANFTQSLEAQVLRVLLVRSTRVVSEGPTPDSDLIPFVPFQNNEEQLIVQAANHLITGRRGVGKSTLLRRAVSLLRATGNFCVVVDMQAYAEVGSSDVVSEIVAAICGELAREIANTTAAAVALKLNEFGQDVVNGAVQADKISPRLKRLIADVVQSSGKQVFVLLDDFHVVRYGQAMILDVLHGALKGAGGWLKVAGLQSFLSPYDSVNRRGLHGPDAQEMSLDLTLVNPVAAQRHLRAILGQFLQLVGIDSSTAAIADKALHRLVWASAGVPRDFLQMFERALDHARRADHARVTLTDANLALGEFGEPKFRELQQDAQNEEETLQRALEFIVNYCLGEQARERRNAFLVRLDGSAEQRCIERLSDVRLVHLFHQSITPEKAGERYGAYMLDYSLFTGFRRRPNVKEVLPEELEEHVKVRELRKLRKLPKSFVSKLAA